MIALLLLVSGAHAADRFVSPDGDDVGGDGSAASPWATLGHALDTIPAAGGDTVWLADGVYSGSTTVTRGFDAPVTVRAERPYGAVLTNVDGGSDVLRVYHDGPARLVFSGLVLTNASGGDCPDGREAYYVVHIQDASEVTLEDSVIFGNDAPGTCNELLKINRGGEGIYVRDIVIRGNLFFDPAPAGGADMIDAVRPGEIDIVDNVFVGTPDETRSHSFLTLKRQAPAEATPRSPRFRVARNVFLHWGGKSDQAFVQLGEDGVAEHEIEDALVENNLFVGDSDAQMAAPVQVKGGRAVRIRANTVVGDLPSSAFVLRVGTESDNPQVTDVAIRNNVLSDPTGTMSRLVAAYGDVDLGTLRVERNLYWNGGEPLPADGAADQADDPEAVTGDPLAVYQPDAVVLPGFDVATGAFASGSATIAEEHRRLVETLGALGTGSPAVGAADASDMPEDDIRGLPRDGEPDLGCYEVGAEASDPGDTGGVADAGGCGCVTGAPVATWTGLLGLLLASTARRRTGS